MFLTFYKFSIFFFHIDQSHIPVIYFHFLIQKGKDTLCSCKCHYNGIHLLADLVDRHTKAFIECQKIIFFLLLEVFFASAKFPRLMDKCVCVFLTQ